MEAELQQAEQIYQLVTSYIVTYSFQILGAIVIMLIGWLIARRAGGFAEGMMLRNKVDVTLSRFSAAGLKVLILILVGIIALGNLGISVTPLVAAVGALSLGAGLALQGMLSNYAAGVAIVVTRPFIVGDTISVQNVTGVVKQVNLGNTILTNEDEVQIMIPNKYIVGEIIHNSFADRLVQTRVDIAYGSDPRQATQLIAEVLKKVEGISTERSPQVGIEAFGESGITIGARFWVRTELQFQALHQANAEIHRVLGTHGIDIPFPQRVVRLLQAETLDAAR